MKAIGAERYEIGVRDAASGKMMNREMTQKEVMDAVPWLKRMNARGNDVYIRPAGDSHGLVLLDDLDTAKIERMKADGLAPAAAIETSPGNYQVWVRLSDKPISADIRAVTARALATRYGGDANSADSRHYGRLSGFTNQKPKHKREKDGRQPYVLLRESHGAVAQDGQRCIALAQESIAKTSAEMEQERRIAAIRSERVTSGGSAKNRERIEYYNREARVLMTKYGSATDFSRVDWAIAVQMSMSGRWTVQEIEQTLKDASPYIDSRKAGHIDDYAQRTARKAWEAPEVQSHWRAVARQEQEREEQRAAQQQQRGMGMGR